MAPSIFPRGQEGSSAPVNRAVSPNRLNFNSSRPGCPRSSGTFKPWNKNLWSQVASRWTGLTVIPLPPIISSTCVSLSYRDGGFIYCRTRSEVWHRLTALSGCGICGMLSEGSAFPQLRNTCMLSSVEAKVASRPLNPPRASKSRPSTKGYHTRSRVSSRPVTYLGSCFLRIECGVPLKSAL